MRPARSMTGIVATVSVSLLLACGDRGFERRRPHPPDILIVMIDALRGDRLGINGYPLPITLNIDQLAREGLNFRWAFAHSTWTKSSIATLFTSVYPSQHGLTQVVIEGSQGPRGQVLASAWKTLAERFQVAGYRTGAVVNQVHIQSRFGFDQGFEQFEARRGTAAPGLNRRLLAWIETLEPEEPFFAYVHYLDVHWPYTYRAAVGTTELGSTEMSVEPPRSGRAGVQAWGRTLELPADLDALEARYDHEVVFVDQQIGELLSSLRALGRFDNTIIVVTADHGEGFLEHGQLLHGYAPYEEMIHIPLVLRLPARLRGEVDSSEVPVGLIDLMPTLLDLADLADEPQAMGRSLVPLFDGGSHRPRLIFAETGEALAVRSVSHKLIRFRDAREQYFDLSKDSDERAPLAGDCGPPCERLAHRLDDFVAAMAAGRPRPVTEVAPLEAQDLEELKSLGYID